MAWYYMTMQAAQLKQQAEEAARQAAPDATPEQQAGIVDKIITQAMAGEGGTVPGNAPENAVIIRRDTPVDVQNEDRFSPMNTFAYSPIAQNYFSIDNAVLAVILWRLAKSDPKALERLMEKYVTATSKLLSDIVNSGKAHPLTALNANTTFAVVAHRFGVITDSGYLKIVDQTRSIIDKLIQLDFAAMTFEGLGSLVEGTTINMSTGKTTGLAALERLVKK